MKNVCGRTTPVSLPLVVVTVELLHELLSKFKSWWLSETASSRWWDIPALPYSTDKSFSHFANQFKLRSGFDSDFWPKERVVQNRFCKGEEITPSGRSITLNLEFTNVTLRSSLKIFQDGEPVHCRFLLQNQLSTWPVLWILFPDCSCDPLTCPPEFHPGQRDLPLRKGAVLSWQGWKGARQFAPHLAVHALCDRCHQQAWATEPSRTTGGGRGLQSHWLWGKAWVFTWMLLPLETNTLYLPVHMLIWNWTEHLLHQQYSLYMYICNTHNLCKVSLQHGARDIL